MYTEAILLFKLRFSIDLINDNNKINILKYY